MRADESPETLPPAALERIRREEEERARADAEERRNHWTGVGVLTLGALVALIPLWQTGDITMIPAIIAGVCLIVGGNLVDPERFVPLTDKALDKIPGRGGES